MMSHYSSSILLLLTFWAGELEKGFPSCSLYTIVCLSDAENSGRIFSSYYHHTIECSMSD